MPFLPGDSLLFTAGMFAGMENPVLKIEILIPLLIAAALLGDNVNYFVGRSLGSKIKQRKRILFFKHEYIEMTEAFYAKHGGKTIILARFVPIVRTIAPFVAGAGSMKYSRYITFCILGAILWVGSVTTLGYLFGNITVIRENFELAILGIIFISLLPIAIGAGRKWMKSRKQKPGPTF
jgi:membrane-associated protein